MANLHLITLQPSLMSLDLMDSIRQVTDGCHAKMFETGGERAVKNLRHIDTGTGGSITLDAHNNLIAIDNIECKNGGAVRVGGLDANGEPVLLEDGGLAGEVRIGMLKAADTCGAISINRGTYLGTTNDVNCLQGSADFKFML